MQKESHSKARFYAVVSHKHTRMYHNIPYLEHHVAESLAVIVVQSEAVSPHTHACCGRVRHEHILEQRKKQRQQYQRVAATYRELLQLRRAYVPPNGRLVDDPCSSCFPYRTVHDELTSPESKKRAVSGHPIVSTCPVYFPCNPF